MMPRLCLAEIGSPHGVRGEVHLRIFAQDPETLLDYTTLSLENGTSIKVTRLRPKGDRWVATLDISTDRTSAEKLTRQKIWVNRAELPTLQNNEWYQADLIGLTAINDNQQPQGRVIAFHDFGAGLLIEIEKTSGTSQLYPFNHNTIGTIDMSGGTITLIEPEGWD